jgi:hypothetical protein
MGCKDGGDRYRLDVSEKKNSEYTSSVHQPELHNTEDINITVTYGGFSIYLDELFN